MLSSPSSHFLRCGSQPVSLPPHELDHGTARLILEYDVTVVNEYFVMKFSGTRTRMCISLRLRVKFLSLFIVSYITMILSGYPLFGRLLGYSLVVC